MFASDHVSESFLVMLNSSFSLALGALLIGGGIETALCQRRRSGGMTTRFNEALLPDSMWPLALAFAGLPAARRLALCSKGTFRRQWDSADFWWQLIQNMGLNPMDIMSNRGLISFKKVALEWKLNNSAALLRDRLRRRILIDDGLLSITVAAQSPFGPRQDLAPRATHAGTTLGRGQQHSRRHASNVALEGSSVALVRASALGLRRRSSSLEVLRRAREAVMVLENEDGDNILARASSAIMAVLRWRGGGAEEAAEAEQILDAVANRTNLFSTSQMLDILGAHQAAEADLFTGIQNRSDDEGCYFDDY